MAQQARQVLAACEKTPTDVVVLDYDPRNPFDVCSITFTPIYRGEFRTPLLYFHLHCPLVSISQ